MTPSTKKRSMRRTHSCYLSLSGCGSKAVVGCVGDLLKKERNYHFLKFFKHFGDLIKVSQGLDFYPFKCTLCNGFLAEGDDRLLKCSNNLRISQVL